MSGCPRCCVRDGNFKASGFGLKKSRNFLLAAKGRKMIGSVSSETVAVFTAPAFSFMDRFLKNCVPFGEVIKSDMFFPNADQCAPVKKQDLFCLKRSVNRAKQGQNGWTPVAKVSFHSCFLDISCQMPGLRRNQWWGPQESPGRITREARNKLRSKKKSCKDNTTLTICFWYFRLSE